MDLWPVLWPVVLLIASVAIVLTMLKWMQFLGRENPVRTVASVVVALILISVAVGYITYQPVIAINYVRITEASIVGNVDGVCNIAGDGLSASCSIVQPFSANDELILSITLHNAWTSPTTVDFTAVSSNAAVSSVLPLSGNSVILANGDAVLIFTITALIEGQAIITVTITSVTA